MIRIHSRCGLFLLLTTATMLAGCGAGPVREAAPASPYHSPVSPVSTDPVPPADSPTPTNPAALPTATRATAPPKAPTDALKKTDLVVGVVTRGGSGPCYGLQTDDGTEYALYSRNALTLTRGSYVKAHTKPATVRIFCGPGRFLEITKLEP
jgi:hypothetical protein